MASAPPPPPIPASAPGSTLRPPRSRRCGWPAASCCATTRLVGGVAVSGGRALNLPATSVLPASSPPALPAAPREHAFLPTHPAPQPPLPLPRPLPTPGKEKPQVLSHTSALLHKFFILVDRRLSLGGGSQVGKEMDNGPTAQRACFDRHPQCELWRDKVGSKGGEGGGPGIDSTQLCVLWAGGKGSEAGPQQEVVHPAARRPQPPALAFVWVGGGGGGGGMLTVRNADTCSRAGRVRVQPQVHGGRRGRRQRLVPCGMRRLLPKAA